MAPEVLTLDEQFFYRLALKNGLVGREDAEECIRVRAALAKRGKKKPLQEIMLDTGLLTAEEVDRITEAQSASQVLRLDSIYGDIAVRLGHATRAQLEEAFAAQRARQYKVRVGELLVERGALMSAQHRQILMELLRTMKTEEREYTQALRLKKRLARDPDGPPRSREGMDEATRIRLATTEVGWQATAAAPTAPPTAPTEAPTVAALPPREPPAPSPAPAAPSEARTLAARAVAPPFEATVDAPAPRFAPAPPPRPAPPAAGAPPTNHADDSDWIRLAVTHAGDEGSELETPRVSEEEAPPASERVTLPSRPAPLAGEPSPPPARLAPPPRPAEARSERETLPLRPAASLAAAASTTSRGGAPRAPAPAEARRVPGEDSRRGAAEEPRRSMPRLFEDPRTAEEARRAGEDARRIPGEDSRRAAAPPPRPRTPPAGAPAVPPPAAADEARRAAPPPVRAVVESTSSEDFLRGSSDDEGKVAVAPLPARGAAAEARAAQPAVSPAARASMQQWLGLDTAAGSPAPAAAPPPRRDDPPKRAASILLSSEHDERPAGAAASGKRASSDELPESFFASNVLAVVEDAHPSRRLPAVDAAGRRAREAGPKPARKVDPARLLESAIETFDEQTDSTAGTQALAALDDVLQIESDISNVDELIQTGASTFGEVKQRRSSGERELAFSTDEYLRRRRRRALLVRAGLAAIVAFVIVPFVAGFYVAWGNESALERARVAIAADDLDAAGEAADAAGSFWVGERVVADVRREVAFRRAIAPVAEARAKRDWAAALETLRAVREREELRSFSAQTAALEAEISLAAHLDRGEALEKAGDLAGAVAEYEQARRAAPPDGTAEKKVAAIRKALEKDAADAEAQGDLERQIEAYRRLNVVFGGKERELETRVLRHDLKKFVAEADAAAGEGDFERALASYYKASAAAQRLGESAAVSEVEEKTRRARRQQKFQEYFARAEGQEKKGRFDEALQSYRGAQNWIERDDAQRQALVQARIEAVERRKIDASAEAEATRLWREAIEALRKSQADAAVAALESLRARKPDDARVGAALDFAKSAADMVYIPAGECTIGSKPADGVSPDETPERRVTIPAFFIDRFEVRNRSYLLYVEAENARRPEHWTVDRGDKGRAFAPEHADHPVVNVSWHEATKYAAWAGKRLPSEEEWEKAARGADGRSYPWGEATDGVKVNVGAKLSERLAILTKPAGTSVGDVSPFGVFDMGGNVSEWTASSYRAYPGNDAKGVGWDEEKRVLRGGSWRYALPYARCAHRDKSKPTDRYNETGFRCAKDIPDAFEELK